MSEYLQYSQDCTEFLKQLIQTPSVNGSDNERAVIDLVVAEAEKLGLPTKIVEKEIGRPNLFIGEGFDSPEGLLLVSHADTVPVGDEAKWDFPPFGAEVDGDKLYGRGALDCKGGIAVSLYALKALYDQEKPLAAKMLVGADEESGADSQFGIRAVLAEGLKAKGAVYTYGGRIENELIIGHRGLLRLWVVCHGESAHSGSLQWQKRVKGENAIIGVLDFLAASNNLSTDTTNEYFPEYRTATTPTLVKGGEGESLVPTNAEALLDIRTLPGDNDTVLQKINQLVDRLSEGKRRYEIRIKNNIPAAITNPEAEIVKEAVKLKGEVYGFEQPNLRGSGPANEAYMLVDAGIPTIVGMGPSGEGFHSANEYAELSSINKSLEFLIKLSLRLENEN